MICQQSFQVEQPLVESFLREEPHCLIGSSSFLCIFVCMVLPWYSYDHEALPKHGWSDQESNASFLHRLVLWDLWQGRGYKVIYSRKDTLAYNSLYGINSISLHFNTEIKKYDNYKYEDINMVQLKV